MKKNIKSILVALLMILSCVVFGCSQEDTEKNELTLVEFSWESIKIHNEIVKNILEGGYDYDVGIVVAESAPGLLGIEQNDAQVAMEVWMDNRMDWWDSVDGETVLNVGDTFTGVAKQGWFIPGYIDSEIDTLKEFVEYCRENSDSKVPLLSAPSGWGSYEITKSRYEGYELSDIFEFIDPGSGSGLDIEITSLYDKGLPFITYYWEPTALLGRIDLRYLEESPYQESLWTPEGQYLCKYPDSKVYKLMNKHYREEFLGTPAVAVVESYNIPTDVVNSMLADISASGISYEDYVNSWMKENNLWHSFVGNDEEVIQKVIQYLDN